MSQAPLDKYTIDSSSISNWAQGSFIETALLTVGVFLRSLA
jgi:hypothetical protein